MDIKGRVHVEQIILMVVVFGGWLIALWNRQWLSMIFIESDTQELLKMCKGPTLQRFQSQRTLQALMICLLMLVSIYLQHKILWVLSWFVLALIVYKIPYLNIQRKFHRLVFRLKVEFPIWLRQLQILLQNNTVVVSLEKSFDYAPTLIQNHLSEFIIGLKNNPMQLDVYTDFLQEYRCVEIQRAMKLLYRYNTVGQEDSMKQLNRMIATTGKWLREQRLNSQSTQTQMKQWWGMLPLFGITVVFLTMMMQTIFTLLERR